MCDLEVVNAEVNRVKAVDAGFIAISREPDAGLDARQRDTGSSDYRACGIEGCAGYGSAAGLSVQGARQSESGGQPINFIQFMCWSPIKSVYCTAMLTGVEAIQAAVTWIVAIPFSVPGGTRNFT